MHLGLFTDSVEALPLDAALDLAQRIGVTGIEIATGGVSRLRHARAEPLLADVRARSALVEAVERRGMRIDALNCSGFPMHPVIGDEQRRSIEATIRLAGELGVRKIVTMSGTPGDGSGATTVNWIWYPWPPDAVALLERQWDEGIALWRELAAFAIDHGVDQIAFELHPLYLVYNVPTLLRMREAVGPVIGANIDPSHMFWQQMDPLAVVRALGPAVFHVHLKDTSLVPDEVALAGVLDSRPFENPGHRAWEFRTIGRGHDRAWWTSFLAALDEAGYRRRAVDRERGRAPAGGRGRRGGGGVHAADPPRGRRGGSGVKRAEGLTSADAGRAPGRSPQRAGLGRARRDRTSTPDARYRYRPARRPRRPCRPRVHRCRRAGGRRARGRLRRPATRAGRPRTRRRVRVRDRSVGRLRGVG